MRKSAPGGNLGGTVEVAEHCNRTIIFPSATYSTGTLIWIMKYIRKANFEALSFDMKGNFNVSYCLQGSWLNCPRYEY